MLQRSHIYLLHGCLKGSLLSQHRVFVFLSLRFIMCCLCNILVSKTAWCGLFVFKDVHIYWVFTSLGRTGTISLLSTYLSSPVCNPLCVLCYVIVTKGVGHYSGPIVTQDSGKSCLLIQLWNLGNSVLMAIQNQFQLHINVVPVSLPLQHIVLGLNRKPYTCLLIQDTCCLFIFELLF